VHRLGEWSVRVQEHRRDDAKTKGVWSMTNKCNYIYRSSSGRHRKSHRNVPHILLNGIATDSHWTASREAVTTRHHEWQLRKLTTDDHWDHAANKITIEGLQIGIESVDYRELSTQSTDWDVYQMGYQNECWKTVLGGYKPAWPMLKEDEHNNWRATGESNRLQERISDIEAGVQSYALGLGERKRVWRYKIWSTVSRQAYEIDTRANMIDHNRWLWNWEPKQLSMHQQWSLMDLDCGVLKELGDLECLHTCKYCEYDRLLECLHVRYTTGMALPMMSSERTPPSAPPSQVEAHTIHGDFTEISVSNYNNDLHVGTSYECVIRRSDSGHSGIGDIEDRATLDVLSLSFSSLLFASLFCYFFDLGPVQMASARVFTTSADNARGGGVSPYSGSTG